MSVSKREAFLKSVLRDIAVSTLPTWVVQRHEDVRYNSVPDFSFTGIGHTSWLEVKHATPDWSDTQNQRVNCFHLAKAGFCRYLFYLEDSHGHNARTLIVHPRDLESMRPEIEWPGFAHHAVVDYIQRVHMDWPKP